ncbi:glycerophosphodiester phosphodiesterase family protein [Flavobacterium sp. DG1-102-2]|uniref:glycerophosphodiester phosphodiesterase n=1 Tax=Flavobacterium sp. DG1-102-2 TaxID=3081663 RepID=UPI00294A7985|nr:glycerophosphodiester phosphodiesterase family protein [Flavobacterium sp. DG1-102-2]MDV6169033.1 glycerophosphodiester phosphodiesterase family protein [Flavobacterium sp. DG1-102-2]
MAAILKIGHRGAKGHVAENTLASFQKALDMGADGIELDVHVCATGELVVIHDFTVDRTTNGSGEVHKMTLSELKKLRVDGEHTIPLLDEVLALVNRKCLVNIEMKGRHTAKPVSDFVDAYVKSRGYSYDDFIVSSFQREELLIMHEVNKNIPLGILTQASVTQAWEWAMEFSAKAIHPHYSLLTESNVKKAQQAGLKVYTWTINDTEDIERIKSYHVDGIISDFPELL